MIGVSVAALAAVPAASSALQPVRRDFGELKVPRVRHGPLAIPSGHRAGRVRVIVTLSLPPLARPPVLLLSLAALVGASMPAGATHLPDHRFLVLGYVTDADGRPVAGARVVVTRLKTGLEYPTTTERDGFYLVVLHLHDENLGEALGVDAKGVKGEVRARFEVSDKKVERGTRVDVRDRRLVENRSAFAETLRAYLSR